MQRRNDLRYLLSFSSAAQRVPEKRYKNGTGSGTITRVRTMPNSCSPSRPPSYRLHRRTGQAVVTLVGRDIYLGKHGTPESREAYQRKIKEWSAASGRCFRGRVPSHRHGGGGGVHRVCHQLLSQGWQTHK